MYEKYKIHGTMLDVERRKLPLCVQFIMSEILIVIPWDAFTSLYVVTYPYDPSFPFKKPSIWVYAHFCGNHSRFGLERVVYHEHDHLIKVTNTEVYGGNNINPKCWQSITSRSLKIYLSTNQNCCCQLSYPLSSWEAIFLFMENTPKEETRGKEKIMVIHSGSI